MTPPRHQAWRDSQRLASRQAELQQGATRLKSAWRWVAWLLLAELVVLLAWIVWPLVTEFPQFRMLYQLLRA